MVYILNIYCKFSLNTFFSFLSFMYLGILSITIYVYLSLYFPSRILALVFCLLYKKLCLVGLSQAIFANKITNPELNKPNVVCSNLVAEPKNTVSIALIKNLYKNYKITIGTIMKNKSELPFIRYCWFAKKDRKDQACLLLGMLSRWYPTFHKNRKIVIIIQRPISETKNVITDFFEYKHVVLTFKTIFKKRLFNKCTYILLLILAMATYTFQRDERQMSYLYLQWVLKWTFDKISNFRSYQSAIQDVMLLVAIPLMSKLLGWRDTVIALIGAVLHIVFRIFNATAIDSWLFYIGGAFASLGPVVAPIIRSMTSKLVPAVERDNAILILSATVYNQVYKTYLETHLQAIFFYRTLIRCLSGKSKIESEIKDSVESTTRSVDSCPSFPKQHCT
ncbi:hypothetical protein RN001_006191 [Aquatica leii]|uniref:Uncharacterized protein n=1 Tax=Aquatica leii TaxID=1421715 RepID=A0AAN7SIF9_9COLE|nr:hypothetical protein RN001_006191 [Aquatica leii]